jgi:mono/diheme cytochrome c family protein
MRYSLLLVSVALAFSGALASRKIKPVSSKLVGMGNVSARSPAELYARNCASCHGKDGRAQTRSGKLRHARNLADSEWQGRVGDERIFNSIMNGKGKMPAYGNRISEQEIDGLVGYVRSLKK